MPTDQPEPKIELEVKNFGPIAEAKIDLRPLTVFVGASNTGKSYLAILLYALHLLFTDRSFELFGHRSEDVPHMNSRFVDIPYRITGSSEARQALIDWVAKLPTYDSDHEGSDLPQPQLPAEVEGVVRQILTGQPHMTAEFVSAIIERCFADVDEIGQLIRSSYRGPASVIVRSSTSSDSCSSYGPTKFRFAFARRKTEFQAEIDSIYPLGLTKQPVSEFVRMALPALAANEGEQVEQEMDRSNVERLITWTFQNLADSALPQLVGSLSAPAFLLPADRTGIMSAHSFVLGTLAVASSYAGTRDPIATPRLSGIHSDFMNQLIRTDVTSPPEDRSSLVAIADGIESAILKGRMEFEHTETGYPKFTYFHKMFENAVPLARASSMASELAPIVFFIRNVVKSGDTLIIEEPESHLHPEAQVQLAMWLARLVKVGVRVIVTTHSEWILDQFSNLRRMSELPGEARQGLSGADAALTPEQFGAWLFETKKSPKGTVVREIGIDPDEGGLGRDYFDTAILTHNTWAEIGNRLTKLGLR